MKQRTPSGHMSSKQPSTPTRDGFSGPFVLSVHPPFWGAKPSVFNGTCLELCERTHGPFGPIGSICTLLEQWGSVALMHIPNWGPLK